ncbi:MAG: carboxypeptidase regulatory-like domain-containing protein [Bacteroidetes bacterium]|nr:carboxypeptidase regulatory-like domain-containing protein [Bacteroidota bacterium]
MRRFHFLLPFTILFLAICSSPVKGQNSVYFNGSARADILTPFYTADKIHCVEAWIRPSQSTSTMVFWSYNQIRYTEQWHGGIDSYMERFLEIGLDNMQPYIKINNDHVHKASTSVPGNVWSHIAVNYEKDLCEIYINGKRVYQKTNMNEGVTGSYYNERSIAFGAVATSTHEPWDEREHYWNWSHYYNGYMSDVRAWSVTRTAREIFENRYKELGATKNLYSEYLMDQVSSTGTLVDNVFDAKYRNSPYYHTLPALISTNTYATSNQYRYYSWWTHIDGSSSKVGLSTALKPYNLYGYGAITKNSNHLKAKGIRAYTKKQGGIISDDYEGLWATTYPYSLSGRQYNKGLINLFNTNLNAQYLGLSDNNWDFVYESKDQINGLVDLFLYVPDLRTKDYDDGDYTFQLMHAEPSKLQFIPVATYGLGFTMGDTLQVRMSSEDLKTGVYTIGISTYVPGRAISLNGKDNYVSGRNLDLTGHFTIEFWAKASEAVRQPLFTHDSISDNTGIYLEIDGQNENLTVYIKDEQFTYNNPFFLITEWGHYALSYDKNARQFDLYVNGYHAKTFTPTNAYSGKKSFYLGMKNKKGFNTYFHGEIDEFRVWKTVRTKNQILAEMQHAIKAGNSDLIRYHRLDLADYPLKRIPDRSLTLEPATLNRGTIINSDVDLIATEESVINGGKSMVFNGLDEYAHAANIQAYNSTQEFCVEAWIKPTYSSNTYHGKIISQQINEKGNRFELAVINQKLTFSYDAPSGTELEKVETGAIIENNKWYHVAANYKNKKITLFVNGVPTATKTSVNRISEGTGNLFIAGDPYNSNQFFKGEMDEVRLWNKAKTVDSIIINKALPLTGMEPGLAALYNFNRQINKQLIDLSGHRNNANLSKSATLVAATWGANTDLNLLTRTHKNRTYKTGLRISTKNYFESGKNDILAFGHYDEKAKVEVREIGETKQFALTRTWYVTKFDDSSNFSGDFKFHFVPNEMGASLANYTDKIPTVFFRSDVNNAFTEIQFSAIEITDSNIVVADVSSGSLQSGYYTLGFKSNYQGSAIGFTKGSQPLKNSDRTIQNHFIRRNTSLTFEFWVSPTNLPTHDVSLLSISSYSNPFPGLTTGGRFNIYQKQNTNEVYAQLIDYKNSVNSSIKLGNLKPNAWQHLRIDVPHNPPSEKFKTYINGALAIDTSLNYEFYNIAAVESNFYFQIGDSVKTDTLKIDEFRYWETREYGRHRDGQDPNIWNKLISPSKYYIDLYYDFNTIDLLLPGNWSYITESNRFNYKAGYAFVNSKRAKGVPANWPVAQNEVEYDTDNGVFTNKTGGLKISSRDGSAAWSHNNNTSTYSNTELPNGVSSRLDRVWAVGIYRTSDADLEFNPKELGVDSFFTSNSYTILYKPTQGAPFRELDSVAQIYVDETGVVKARLIEIRDRNNNESLTGYLTLGWRDDNFDTYITGTYSRTPLSFPERDTFTLEFMYNPANSSGNFLDLGTFRFEKNATNGYLNLKSNNINLSSGQAYSTWTHVALTHIKSTNSTIVKLYINGVLKDSVSTGYRLTPGTITIENGEIDELRFWKTIRTVAQINNSKQKKLLEYSSSLMAYFSFNQNKYFKTIPNLGAQPRLHLFRFNINSQNYIKKSTTFGSNIGNLANMNKTTTTVTQGGLTISNYLGGNNTFARDNGDTLKLGALTGTGILTNASIPANYQSTITALSNRWYVKVLDAKANGGYVKLSFDFDAFTSLNHKATKDQEYYLLYSPSKDGVWQIISVPSFYINQSQNTVEFSINVSSLPNGYYGIGLGEKGWVQNLYFDGANDYITMGTLSQKMKWQDNQAFSIEAWVKPEGSGTVFSKTSGGTNGINLGFNESGYLIGQLGGDNNKLISSIANKPDAYNHVAMIYTGDSMKLMVNGKHAGARSVGQINSAENYNAYLGASSQSGRRTNLYTGYIDEIRIWNKALEPYEVRNYALGNVMNDSNLVYRYSFNHNYGNAIGNKHKIPQIARLKNIEPNQFKESKNTPYVFDTKDLRIPDKSAPAVEIKSGGLNVFAYKGANQFIKQTNDVVYFGHNNDSLTWTSNHTEANIDARFKREWHVNINDYQLDGGYVGFTFQDIEWNGPQDSLDYYLLYRSSLASDYRLVRYRYNVKDVSNKLVFFSADATKLRSGYYTLGYAHLGKLFTASDTISDANIYINYKIPAYCLQNNDAKPVIIQVENSQKKVIYEHRLDSFSINTAYVDSFTHYVDANVKDLYTMNIYKVGPGTKVCPSLFSDSGSTKPFVVPQIFKDSIYLHKHRIYWADSSGHGNAYRLTRISSTGDTAITTLDSNARSYVDSIGGPLNPINGVTYTYCIDLQSKNLNKFFTGSCVTSKTIPVNLKASDNAYDNKVAITWNNISTHTPKIELLRDGALYALLNNDDSTYTDLNPVHGKKHYYALAVYFNNKLVMHSGDTGWVESNGKLAGNVRTLTGLYAVPNCTITASARIDDSVYTYTTTTNDVGFYEINKVYFGKEATFQIRATKKGHEFVASTVEATLNASNKTLTEQNFESTTVYNRGTQNVGSLSMSVVAAPNHNVVEWGLQNTNGALFQVFRNDSLLQILKDTNEFVDAHVVPHTKFTYKVNAYLFRNDSVSEKSVYQTKVSNAIAPITQSKLKLIENKDLSVIDLSWEYIYSHYDGFAIYRDGKWLADVNTKSYRDLTGLNLHKYQYHIAVYKVANNVRRESAKVSIKGTYPALNTPTGLKLQANQAAGDVRGNLLYNVPQGYNFSGILVYRTNGTDTSLVTTINKRKTLFFNDTNGIYGTTYTYFAKAYKYIDSAESLPVSGSIEYPALPAPTISEFGIVNGNYWVYKLKWKANTAHYTGTYVVFEGKNYYFPKGQEEQIFTVIPPTNAKLNYIGIATYCNKNGTNYYSNATYSSVVTYALTAGTLPDVTNFTASNNNAGFVRLNWEYPKYVKPIFNIYRDGYLLKQVKFDARSFNDKEAEPGKLHSYMIIAYYGSAYSKVATAYGKSTSSYILNGEVRNKYTGNGIENVRIVVKGNSGNNQFEKSIFTDKTGYYQLPIPKVNNLKVTVAASKQNHLFSGGSLTLYDTANSYQYNFVDTTKLPKQNDNNIAQITQFLATSNESRQNVVLRFNVSGINYSGLEIKRGPRVIAKLRKGESLNYIDTSGIPGYTYIYSARLYWEAFGTTRYSSYITGAAQYPDVAPVEDLVATVYDSISTVQLEWSHPNELVDEYAVYRNGNLIASVPVGSFGYADTNGMPGQRQRYEVAAINITAGRKVASVKKAVNAKFPTLPRVYNLSAQANADSNALKLSWFYPVARTRGYLVLRNNEIIDTVKHQKNSFSYSLIDTFGNPGIANEYAVAPYTFINKEFTKATPISIRTVFPGLAKPNNFSATARYGADLVRMNWDYPTHNITGFVVFRDGVELARLPKSQSNFDDATGLPEVTYNYSVVAYSIRRGKQFISNAADANVTFPKVSGPRRLYASQHTSMVHIMVNWEHNGWLQRFNEERGYELEYATWPLTNQLEVNSNSTPNSTSTWLKLDDQLAHTQRYFPHLNPTLFENITGASDMAANLYRIRSYRRINGTKYYSQWQYATEEGLTQESREANYKPTNFIATQGTKSGIVTLTWKDNSTSSSNFIGYNIYRKGYITTSFELLGTVGANREVFHDDEVVDGTKYIYEIRPSLKGANANDQYERGVAALGWSTAAGTIKGIVQTEETSSPVAGATITASNKIGKELYVYTTTTDANGAYRIDNVYAPSTNPYEVEVDFLDHEFVEKVQEISFSKPTNTETLPPFVDRNSFVIKGIIKQANTKCGLDSVKVKLKATYNDGSTKTQEALTAEDGSYAIVYNPFESNLVKLEILADTFKIFTTRPSQDTSILDFDTNYLLISNPKSVATVTNFNLSEKTVVPVNINLRTTCGPIPGDNQFIINVQSTNGCYNEVFKTNAKGELRLTLPPKKYRLTVIGVSPLTQTNYPYVEYFTTVNKTIDITNLTVGDSISTTYTYHTIPNISYSGLNNYCGNNINQPAIVNTKNRYSIWFGVKEKQFGVCNVEEGFLVVYNDAIEGHKGDTLRLEEDMEFETYLFQPDNPNPSPPHLRTLRVEYYAPDIGFLNELVIPLIVEGQSRIPGNDIIVNPSENGDVQLPLFVLRDPPGDGSYSYIEKGSTYTQNISMDKSTAFGAGGYVNFLGVYGKTSFKGIHLNIDAGNTKTTTNAFSFDVSSTFNQRIQTSESSDILNKSASNYLMQEDADVIVGAGLVSKYGLTWQIEVKDQKACKVDRVLTVATGPGEIKTTWVYTVDHIKGLVNEYDDKIKQVRKGTLVVTGEDTTTSIKKFTTYKDNWNQVLEYHQKETNPYYCLCDKINYYRLPKPWQNYLTSEPDITNTLRKIPYNLQPSALRLITESFCGKIGSYSPVNGRFVINDNFEWTQAIISDYNLITSMLSDWNSHGTQFLKVLEDFDYKNGFTDVGWSTEYNWRFAPEAKNVTFSGGTSFEESFQAEKSRTKTTIKSSTTTVDLNGGFSLRTEPLLYLIGAGGTKTGFKFELDIGARLNWEWNYNDAETTGEGEQASIGYVLSDDDPGDQYSVTVIKGVHPNHSPYFSLLGGRSSCPDEPGTISRDQYTMELGDSLGNVYSPVQRFLDPDEPAIYKMKITNNSPFGEGRWYTLLLNTNSNRKNAYVSAYGNEVGANGIDFFLPGGKSEHFDLIVKRSPGVYAHEDIVPDLQTQCDGYFTHRLVFLKAYWQHPCTDVDIISENNFAIYANPGGKEQYFTILGGYDVENELLQRVNLKYRRIGDENWTTWAVIPRDTLVNYHNRTKTNPPRPPRYPIYWDITGNQKIVDGEYEIVAEYICAEAGTMRSNVVQGKVDRSAFKLVGKPEPTDAILSLGEKVIATYNKHIAEHKFNSSHFNVWYVENGKNVPVTVAAQANKNQLIFFFTDSLRSLLEGKQVHVKVDSLWDINNRYHQQAETWKFTISNNPVYWHPTSLKLATYSGSKTSSTAMLQYSENGIAKNYTISFASGTWLSTKQLAGTVALTGEEIMLSINAASLEPGLYRDTVIAQIASFGSIYLPIELHVARKKPNWHVDLGKYEQSVHVMANYTFGSNQLSTDTMDLIAAFIGSELRGVSRIIKSGTRYVAYVPVHGNATDKGRKVHFRVWKASNGNMYDAWLSNNDTIKFNPSVALHGSLMNPRILNIKAGRDIIRTIPLRKGWNWLSLNIKQEKLEDALLSLNVEDGDVIKTLNSSSEFTDKFGNGGSWISTSGLTNIAPENGYLLYISNADTLLISGDTATNYKLNVNAGWNLIGYPKQAAESLNYVNFNPVSSNGDMLKSQAEVAIYDQGAWNGSLTKMEPYQAYMLKVGQKGTVSFKKTPRPENWQVDPSAFEFNMTVTARMLFDGSPSVDTNDIVGAFVNGDLRGVGKVSWLPQIRKYRVVMFVYSNTAADEEISFQLYDSDKELLYDAHETIDFVANQRLGKLSDPYLLSDVPTSGVKVATWIDKQMSAYPNPTNGEVTLQFQNKGYENCELIITDFLGRRVHYQAIQSTPGKNRIMLNTEELGMAKGVYQVSLTSKSFNSSIKLIKE